MNGHSIRRIPGLLLAVTLLGSTASLAAVRGETGSTSGCAVGVQRCFALVAASGSIVTGDGNSLPAWGYAIAGGAQPMQYPGPTLIVNQGERVSFTLSNSLPLAASIVFPGQIGVTAAGGVPGALTQEVSAGAGTVTYTFTASKAGTFLYHSGTRPEIQVEFGLVGALIVRPAGFDTAAPKAYGPASTAYDREYLYLLTEMDRSAHEQLGEIQQLLAASPGSTFDQIVASLPEPADGLPKFDPARFTSTLWFINGRNGPDTLLEPQVGWLPAQPYNATTRAHPGDRVLMRIVGAGRDLHPFHHHGNNAWLIARDGQVLQSAEGASAPYPDFQGIPSLAARGETLPDLAVSNFTIQAVPGSTYDAIFTWTGLGLGWDFYGHRDPDGAGPLTCPPLELHEDPASHCKTFTQTNGDTLPVTLPEQQALTFGGFWSGAPYLGGGSALPPGEGGLNPNAGYTFMWHSHTERELTNDDIFPGGMMTMMIIEPATAAIAD
jgi:manganese oxidase